MSKTERIITWLAIGVSLLMSVIALCRSLPCVPGLDYMGVIIGILTLLVTVLIGWNIYTVVDFNRREEEVKEIINTFERTKTKLEKDIDTAQNKMKTQWNIDILNAVPIMVKTQLDKDLASALILCFNTYKRTRRTESVLATEMAINYVRSVADVLFADGREHNETVRYIIDDIKNDVQTENVQLMWNDVFLRKDANDAQLLAFLLEISQGMSRLPLQGNHT